MNEDTLFFFDAHRDALPLYETLESRLLDEIEDVRIKVQKTQISFYNRHMFACVSFAKVRKKKDLPSPYLVVTVGLNRRLESSRVEIAVQPYPNRWTHHLIVSDKSEIDGELMAWLKEAAAFSDIK